MKRPKLAERFAENLRRIREARGMSYRTFGSLVGYSGMFIHQIENKERTPSLGCVEDISKALDVDPNVMLGGNRG